jgi:hypothetical protein
MMKIHEILDRYELLFPNDKRFEDLRRFHLDGDQHSLFRLLESFSDSQLITAYRKLREDTSFADDCLARGQIQSKLWLVTELKKLDLDLGTIFLCAGWYATLATMLFEQDLTIKKIRSFDIDDSCWKIAETFNKPWVMKDWQFKSSTQDIHDINFSTHVYNVNRSDGSTCELTDSPDTIINTSCEHIADFKKWYNNIPNGKILILQTNNYFDLDEHINCSKSVEDFSEQTAMEKTLYQGELVLDKYSRYMKIGIK